jgi:type II secretory pathway pseudopilin PulG
MRDKRVRKLCTKLRTKSGVYMIELIAAIATSAMLSAALVETMASTERLSTSGQNQIIAAAVAQEQVDNVRDTLYGNLIAGTYTLLLNKRTLADAGPTSVNPRPLLFDLLDFDWRTPAERAANSSQIACSASSEFQNLGADASVTETVVDNGTSGSLANTKTITITINWTEGIDQRTYVVSTLVAQNGIHIY